MSCKRSNILHCWMPIYHIAILYTVHVTCPIQPNNIDYIKEEWPITKGYWSHSYIVIMWSVTYELLRILWICIYCKICVVVLKDS